MPLPEEPEGERLNDAAHAHPPNFVALRDKKFRVEIFFSQVTLVFTAQSESFDYLRFLHAV